MIDKPKLTFKQEKFVQEYVKNGENGTQAALVAYDTQDPDVAKVIASENLTKPNVAGAIERYRSRVHETLDKALAKNNVMVKAIARAERDLDSEDPRLVATAQKFLIEIAKLVDTKEEKVVQHQHAHMHIPKR